MQSNHRHHTCSLTHSQTAMSGSKPRDIPNISNASDTALHHNSARASRSHAARSCRKEEPTERSTAARGSQQVRSSSKSHFSNSPQASNAPPRRVKLKFLLTFFRSYPPRQMHDEVSETENLRKNLAVERMIVEGCDILLDVNQVFVRQGSLVQVPPGRGRLRSRLASFKSDREYVRQCFLFSNHMIVATR